MTTPLPIPEDARLAELRSYGILDTAPEQDFDDIAGLAAELCEAPVALVSFVDDHRQWFKAHIGFDGCETDLSRSFCRLAIRQEDVFEIPDLTADPRTAGSPLLSDHPDLRFYAGAPLITESGHALGTLCVLDFRVRSLTDLQRRSLRVLARQVIRQLDARRHLRLAEIQRKEVDHRVKNSLQSVASYARILSFDAKTDETRAALSTLQGRIETVAALHEALYRTDAADRVDLGRYLVNVGALLKDHCPPHVNLAVAAGPAIVPTAVATACATIVNEVVANAIKHAFPGGRPGTISVTGHRVDGDYRLDCSDDGVGVSVDAAQGLGTQIIAAAAGQIGGVVETQSAEVGHHIEVRLPLGG